MADHIPPRPENGQVSRDPGGRFLLAKGADDGAAGSRAPATAARPRAWAAAGATGHGGDYAQVARAGI